MGMNVLLWRIAYIMAIATLLTTHVYYGRAVSQAKIVVSCGGQPAGVSSASGTATVAPNAVFGDELVVPVRRRWLRCMVHCALYNSQGIECSAVCSADHSSS